MVTLAVHWYVKIKRTINGFYLALSAGAQTIAMFISLQSLQKFQNIHLSSKISDYEKRIFSKISNLTTSKIPNFIRFHSIKNSQHWFNQFHSDYKTRLLNIKLIWFIDKVRFYGPYNMVYNWYIIWTIRYGSYFINGSWQMSLMLKVYHIRFELRKFLRACKHGKACGFSRQSSFKPRFERPFETFSLTRSLVVSSLDDRRL